ncbi:P-loop containing nucleoside triphosphate hydrolase protein [Chiua virens]|nr:P-loop containing nucleoside triphosphate hydrolase protein [Chiua virens]
MPVRLFCEVVRRATSSVSAKNRLIVSACRSHGTHLNSVVFSPRSTVPLPKRENVASDESNGFSIDTAWTSDMRDQNNKINDANEDSLSFKYLECLIDNDTFMALTVHSLQLHKMTPVQERVMALLPCLVRPWDPEGIVPLTVPTHIPSNLKPPVVDCSFPRDILVRAKTGTGKTFAYLIPAIVSRLNHVQHRAKLAVVNAGLESSPHIAGRARVAYRRGSVGPLILASTRELAIQIANDAQKLTMHQKDFEVQLLVGGSGKQRQLRDWMESPRDIVVATPGRLRDLLTNEPEFRQGFKDCPLLILDEADTLLSMGFRDDIDAIVSFLPPPPVRQTFLFSATMPRAVRQLSSWILSPSHIFINAAAPGSVLTPHQDAECVAQTKHPVPSDNEPTTHNHIEQFHTQCPTASDQLPTLIKLLAHDQLIRGPSSKVIVFCPTVQMTKLFSMLLRSLAEKVLPGASTEVMTMHPKMKQSERDRARVLFRKAGSIPNPCSTVLVSSDISAREVDYPGVTRVVQIGIPSKEALYIHRIGRMARGVNSFGKADGGPVVRADLLTLPWEAGYMNWQLTSLPIKSLPICVLDRQLASFSPDLCAPTTESCKAAFAEIQHRVDTADIRLTAASLLGYYLPLTPALRLQPNDVFAGISSWSSECFGLSIPPLTRFPRKFTQAYEQSTRTDKNKGLYVDGLRIAGPSALGKAKSKNRSVWEGADTRKKKPKRWH